jgi:hypothetical protein
MQHPQPGVGGGLAGGGYGAGAGAGAYGGAYGGDVGGGWGGSGGGVGGAQGYAQGYAPGYAGGGWQQAQAAASSGAPQLQNLAPFSSFEQVAQLAENPLFQGMAKDNMKVMQEQLASKYLPGASSLWNSLRYYFHVDNRYVLRKISLVVFPWAHKDWQRIHVGDDGGSRGVADFAPPVADLNAPDMYLPVMSFVTYLLCLGFLKGTVKAFNPEVLVNNFSTSLLAAAFEVACVKGGLYYLAEHVHVSWLDLFALSGYKYVALALALLLGIALGMTAYKGAMLYSCAAVAFFMYQTMDRTVPRPGPDQAGHKRRKNLVIAAGALQCAAMFFLGFTRDLQDSTFFGMGVAQAQAAAQLASTP